MGSDVARTTHNSENGVVDVRTTGDFRQLRSFCARLNQKIDFRYAVLVSPVLVLKVSNIACGRTENASRKYQTLL